MELTDQELLELVSTGERRGVEFKGPRPRTNRHQLAEVARAALGMSNKRDGGLIFVGVSDQREVQGLTALDADTWRRPDDVRASLARYADPFISVDVELVTIGIAGPTHGRIVAVLTVHEFETIPVLCAQQVQAPGGDEILRLGALYVRSNRLPSTTEVADHAHLREVLDLATEKGVRDFLRRARAAGLEATGAALATDEDRFTAQQKRDFDE